MKVFYVLLVLMLFSQYNNKKQNRCDGVDAEMVADCQNRETDKTYCCFVKYEIEEPDGTEPGPIGFCLSLTVSEHDDVYSVIEKKRNELSGKNVIYYSIDCNSNYIKLAIISLIMLLLF